MEQKLKELSLLADKSYNLCCVLKDYCKTNSNCIEAIANLCPLVENLHSNIDTLNSIFIDMDSDENEC